ncbi:ATP12 ATPase family protein [Ophiocordyceps sinensis CO18]|uniref:ATP12 ATPase family protein n=1 Tax=Ophiocordyceps sinensis (strain Co18 / CGMCC 3.14243) TaxID=911162 RepID=T5AGN8_OPHSC|nr:ATP12 ATPase family protein [Ophiocordyceps sinensis CO18]
MKTAAALGVCLAISASLVASAPMPTAIEAGASATIGSSSLIIRAKKDEKTKALDRAAAAQRSSMRAAERAQEKALKAQEREQEAAAANGTPLPPPAAAAPCAALPAAPDAAPPAASAGAAPPPGADAGAAPTPAGADAGAPPAAAGTTPLSADAGAPPAAAGVTPPPADAGAPPAAAGVTPLPADAGAAGAGAEESKVTKDTCGTPNGNAPHLTPNFASSTSASPPLAGIMKAPTLGLRLLPRAVNGSTNARPMHSSAAQAAKVVPIVGTGPPPEPPLPVARPSNDRIERRKRQAELLRATRVIRNADSGKVTTLRKRFWKDVSVNEVNGEPPSLCDNGASLCGNGASLCGNRGRARGPVSQRAAAETLSFLSTHVWAGVVVRPVLDGHAIVPRRQPEGVREAVQAWVEGLDAWEIAGLERAVLAGKSLVAAARVVAEWSEGPSGRRHVGAEGKFGIQEAAKAVSLEVDWQTTQWGEVEDTHDVQKEDLRRQLGSVVLLVSGTGQAA